MPAGKRIILLSGIVLAGFLLVRPVFQENAAEITIRFHGAAERVSGSMNEVSFQGKKYLVDCGLYYPEQSLGGFSLKQREKRADLLNRIMPVDAGSVSAVFITHAHLDHCGRLPLLFEKGFRGTIYATEGTARFLPVMLTMAVRYPSERRKWVYSRRSVRERDGKKRVTVHWNRCKWQKKISERNKRSFHGSYKELEEAAPEGIDIFSPCKLCARQEVDAIMRHVHTVREGKLYALGENLRFRFVRTGHIPGAASVWMEFKSEAGKRSVLFSGDVGNDYEILYPKPQAFPPADAVVLESTYGPVSVSLAEAKKEEERFLKDLHRNIAEGQTVIIPAFAMDRTQKMLYELFIYDKIYFDLPIVYCPSPSADKISRIYHEGLQNRSYGWFKNSLYYYSSTDLFRNYKKSFPHPPESAGLIITTSGMMDNAFATELLDLVERPSTSVFIVGYQDPETPGGYLRRRVKSFVWDGKRYRVKARVYDYHVFSAHANPRFMLKLLEKQDKNRVKLILNHGEKKVLEQNKRFYESKGFGHVEIVRPKKKLRITLQKQPQVASP